MTPLLVNPSLVRHTALQVVSTLHEISSLQSRCTHLKASRRPTFDSSEASQGWVLQEATPLNRAMTCLCRR